MSDYSGVLSTPYRTAQQNCANSNCFFELEATAQGPSLAEKITKDASKQTYYTIRLLAGLGISNLQDHIKFEVNYTPLSWRKRYNLVKGSTHGLSHTLTQLGYLRPSNRHAQCKNLYFTGASTHPGTGVPTALVSGRLAARRLLEETAVVI